MADFNLVAELNKSLEETRRHLDKLNNDDLFKEYMLFNAFFMGNVYKALIMINDGIDAQLELKNMASSIFHMSLFTILLEERMTGTKINLEELNDVILQMGDLLTAKGDIPQS